MKNIQPDMKLPNQIRKGMLQAADAFIAGDRQKGQYIVDLVKVMIDSANDGQPQPWSQFSPMIDEEFSE